MTDAAGLIEQPQSGQLGLAELRLAAGCGQAANADEHRISNAATQRFIERLPIRNIFSFLSGGRCRTVRMSLFAFVSKAICASRLYAGYIGWTLVIDDFLSVSDDEPDLVGTHHFGRNLTGCWSCSFHRDAFHCGPSFGCCDFAFIVSRRWRRCSSDFGGLVRRIALRWRSQRIAGRFIAVSDLHFDPFCGAGTSERTCGGTAGGVARILAEQAADRYGSYGRDTTWPLLESALDQMRAVEPDPAFLILTGDLLAHRFRSKFEASAANHGEGDYRAFVDKTVTFSRRKSGAAFPTGGSF